jgi:hypothetical protein
MQNNYYQPLPTGATGLSMLDYLIFSNQIQTGLLLADLSAHSWSQFQHSPAANNTGLFGMGGGDWGGSTGSDIGGGDWGGSDMGGGDWGGDFGGGGDFGDGGGGW